MNKSLQKVILKPTNSIEEAIKVINTEKPRIVLVTNKKNELVGTVTDGDIRRALLKHLPLSHEISNIMCTSPKTALDKLNKNEVFKIMKGLSLSHMPIVDDKGLLVGVETIHSLTSLDKTNNNMVVIMAGGFGKRLQPLTDNTPKPMLKIGGIPILELIIQKFINYGFKNFMISTHYQAQKIRDYFDDGSRWGVDINYLFEERPLGTAGALSLIDQSILSSPFFVINGDILTEIDFNKLIQFHDKKNCNATVCVREFDFEVPYGVVKSDDFLVKEIVEKPVHKFLVNAGIYVLDPKVISMVPKDLKIDMPELLGKLISENKNVSMFPLHEYWIDIGQIGQLNKAQYDIEQSHNE